MKRVAIFLLLAIGLSTAMVWAVAGRDRERVEVRTVVAERGTIRSLVSATGSVISSQEAKIRFERLGRIREILVDEGDIVDKNQVLAVQDDRIATSLVRRTEERLSRHKEQMLVKEKDLARARQLYTAKNIAYNLLDQAESELRIAEAQYDETRQGLVLAKLELERTALRVPFSGVVSLRQMEVGEIGGPEEDRYIVVTSLSSKMITAEIDASESAQVSIGQTVFVTSDSWLGEQWMTEIQSISPVIYKDGSSSTFRIRLPVPKAMEAMKIGQQVDLQIVVAEKTSALTLPFSAIKGQSGDQYVVRVDAGTARLVPVTIGIEDLTHTEILTGVAAGDEVVVSQGAVLVEGQQLKATREPSP